METAQASTPQHPDLIPEDVANVNTVQDAAARLWTAKTQGYSQAAVDRARADLADWISHARESNDRLVASLSKLDISTMLLSGIIVLRDHAQGVIDSLRGTPPTDSQRDAAHATTAACQAEIDLRNGRARR